VAVHGLRAHPIKNWMSKGEKPVMWLQDLLPKDLPQARVMNFGYNSNIVENASVSSIRDFAMGLLNDLDSYRIDEVYPGSKFASFRPLTIEFLKERERPIIFICHSLGGLVVKQASENATLQWKAIQLMYSRHSALQAETPRSNISILRLMVSYFWAHLIRVPALPTLVLPSQTWSDMRTRKSERSFSKH
jgi:hypothetical protein